MSGEIVTIDAIRGSASHARAKPWEWRPAATYVNDRPGLGIDLDERAAARFPITDDPPFDFRWGNYRRRDGTIVKP